MKANFALKHWLLAIAQFAFLLGAACSSHVFDARFSTSEFFGHLGPGGYLVGLGAFELSTLEHSRYAMSSARVQMYEGRAAMVGSLFYVLGSSWHRSATMFGLDLNFLRYSLREQQHVSMMAVIFMCGVLSVRLENGTHAKQQLPMAFFSISFGLFIAQHEQPNVFGYYMHWATCAFVVLHAVARVSGNRLSAAAFIFVAGYLFFYGQSGIVVYVEAQHATNPTAFLLASLSFALVWLFTYTIAFPDQERMQLPDFEVDEEETETLMLTQPLKGTANLNNLPTQRMA
jgi:hypothetical protein